MLVVGAMRVKVDARREPRFKVRLPLKNQPHEPPGHSSKPYCGTHESTGRWGEKQHAD